MSAVIGRKLWKGWYGKWACKGVTRNAVVSLIYSPTSPYCYKCSLFIGLNYRLCGVYNSAHQLLQYIMGIFLYLLFVSGVILSCRPQVLGLRDQPAHQASGFGDGPLDLRRRSPPHQASGFGDGPLDLRRRSLPHRASGFGEGPLGLRHRSPPLGRRGRRPPTPSTAVLLLGSLPLRAEAEPARPRRPRAPSSGYLHTHIGNIGT